MTVLETLFGFKGRINRATFWLCIAAIVLLNAAVMLGMQSWIAEAYPDAAGATPAGGGMLALGLPMLIGVVLSVWAGVALGVKRLHDRGKNGLWLLVGLIPVLGPLWLLWDLGLAPGRDDESDGPPASEPDSWLAAPLVEPPVASPAAAIVEPAGAASQMAAALPEHAAVHEPTAEDTRAQISENLDSVDHVSTLPPEEPPVVAPVAHVETAMVPEAVVVESGPQADAEPSAQAASTPSPAPASPVIGHPNWIQSAPLSPPSPA